jgi:hypothetical protein
MYQRGNCRVILLASTACIVYMNIVLALIPRCLGNLQCSQVGSRQDALLVETYSVDTSSMRGYTNIFSDFQVLSSNLSK